jgi:predicted CXXCH cytochrome family protein
MACLIGTAHMGDSPEIERLAINDCLGCHDGGLGKSWQIVGEHIVDIVYAASPLKELAPVRDKRVLLINDKVTCLTCHNPYKSSPGALAKSNENSRLCLTCHIK